MRTLTRMLLAIAAALAFPGCQYEKSLGTAADTKIPDEILGRWHQPADPNVEGRKHDSFLVIHRCRDGRLLVDYEFQEDEERVHWYFTGHPVLAGKPEWLELELVGNHKGDNDVDEPYLLAKWKRDGEKLVWQMLDTAKLDPGKGGATFRQALTEALAANRDFLGAPSNYQKVPVPPKS